LFHELAKAEADILQKCFHKPREVLHCEMQREGALDSFLILILPSYFLLF